MSGYNRCNMDDWTPVLLPSPPPVTDLDFRRFLELAKSALGADWIEMYLLLEGSRRSHRYCRGTKNGVGRCCLLESSGLFRAELRHDGLRSDFTLERLLGFALEQSLTARHMGAQARLGIRAMDATSSAVLLFNYRGEIVYANPRAEELLVRQTMGELRVELSSGANLPLLSHLTRLAVRQVSGAAKKLSGRHDAGDGTRVVWELAALEPQEPDDAPAVLAVVRIVGPDTPRVAKALVAQFSLTRREGEVVENLLRGRSTREIAQHMGISQHTVRDHIKHVFRKTGVRSRRELLVLAGTIGVDDSLPSVVSS